MNKVLIFICIVFSHLMSKAQPFPFKNDKGLFGFKNNEGKVIIEPKFQYIYENPNKSIYVIVKSNYKFGLINSITAKEVLLCNYDSLSFNLNYNNRYYVHKKGIVYAIDTLGRTDYFHEKPYVTKKYGKYGLVYSYIDPNTNTSVEKTIVKHDYDEMEQIKSIENYLVYIVKRAGKYGIINSFGDIKIPIEYEKIEVEDVNGITMVYVEGKNKSGLYNINGEIYVYPMYDEVKFLQYYDYSITKKDGKYGIYTKKKEVIKPIYDDIFYKNKQSLLGLKKDGKWAVYFLNNKKLSAFKYDKVIQIQNDTLKAQTDKKIFNITINEEMEE